jgi:uncharacterized protein (TIGR00251 family)
MRIFVTVVPLARSTRVERVGGDRFRVSIAAPPREGRANAAVVEVLARYFGVPRARVRIVQGHSARRKIVEVSRPG